MPGTRGPRHRASGFPITAHLDHFRRRQPSLRRRPLRPLPPLPPATQSSRSLSRRPKPNSHRHPFSRQQAPRHIHRRRSPRNRTRRRTLPTAIQRRLPQTPPLRHTDKATGKHRSRIQHSHFGPRIPYGRSHICTLERSQHRSQRGPADSPSRYKKMTIMTMMTRTKPWKRPSP